jgi:hypothetical protein
VRGLLLLLLHGLGDAGARWIEQKCLLLAREGRQPCVSRGHEGSHEGVHRVVMDQRALPWISSLARLADINSATPESQPTGLLCVSIFAASLIPILFQFCALKSTVIPLSSAR